MPQPRTQLILIALCLAALALGAGAAPEAPEGEAAGSAQAESEKPKITLYMTTWCGYCRKANKLLTELDADFAAKDIEKDREAALEFRQKSGGQSGIPLIDFDGEVVRGYNERLIRELVAELQEESRSRRSQSSL